MSDDNNPHLAGHKPPTRTRRPGELLTSFRDAKHRQVDVELRDHGSFGWEVQVFVDREFRYSRRFDSRALAEQWAELERHALGG